MRRKGLTQVYSLNPGVADAMEMDREEVMQHTGWSEDQMKLLDELSVEYAIEMYWFIIRLITCKTFPKWYRWFSSPRDQAGKETEYIMNILPSLQEQDLKVLREVTRADIEAVVKKALSAQKPGSN